MSVTGPNLRIVLTVLGAAACIAASLTLASCGAKSGQSSGGGANLDTTAHSGRANDDARVVLDALGDHADLGVCARKDPESVDRSWSAPLVALPATLLGGNAGCGRHVLVSNANGTSVTATVVGSCQNCSGDDISVSPELFHQLASFGQLDGAIQVTWEYVS